MGVKGLWRWMEANRPPSQVPPESLAGLKIAIDISIWLYQAQRAPQPLAVLFQRTAKLLHYGIKPVMIFDGEAPALKRQRLQERRMKRGRAEGRLRQVARRLLRTRLEQLARSGKDRKRLESKAEAKIENDFEFEREDSSPSENEDLVEDEALDRVDVDSEFFQSLPLELMQEILLMKRERLYRQRHRQHLISEEAEEGSLAFSLGQVEALVKRRHLASKLERMTQTNQASSEGGPVVKARRLAATSKREYVLVKNEHGWTFDPALLLPPEQEQKDKVKGLNEVERKANEDKVLDYDDDDELLAAMQQSATIQNAGEKKTLSQEEEKEDERLVDSGKVEGEPYRKDEKETDLGKFQAHGKNERGAVQEVEKEEEVRCAIEIKKDDEFKVIEIDAKNKSDEFEMIEVDVAMAATQERMAASLPFIPIEIAEEEDGVSSSPPPSTPPTPPPPAENLNQLENLTHLEDEDLETMLKDLQAEARRLETQTALPTGDSELLGSLKSMLDLFGIPWLQAPFEAESQAAWMAAQGLVDGIITDDSDVLVFLAAAPQVERTVPVYRHFFDSRSPLVSRYEVSNSNLILLMALLLGGDYAEGVKGLGPVKASKLGQELSNGGDQMEDLLNSALGMLSGGDAFEIPSHLKDPFQLDRLLNAYRYPIIEHHPPPFEWLPPAFDRLEAFLALRLQQPLTQIRQQLQPLRRKH